MFERHYAVTLLSDVVITADAATAGNHQGLDYLPGSLFLGAAVAQAQREGGQFDPGFFLSGRVRFLDALPAANGQPTVPIPFCFHKIKGGAWDGQAPWNPLANACLDKGQQPQQWRRGYMTENGMVAEVALQHRMKNAIDREKRRSAEGKLFGYESIPEGTVFHLRVQADAESDLRRVDSWFDKHELRVGRSRSAEYGAVKLDRLPPNTVHNQPCPNSDLVVLFLLSDLALTRDGMPVLLPDGADFGLPGADLLPDKCFVRSRRYAPWNAFFNCRMSERQVLCKGSVLAFRTTAACDLTALQARLAPGVGLHREEGLGQIRVNPKWLFDSPAMTLVTGCGDKAQAGSDPKSALTMYLRDKTQRRAQAADAFKQGIAWAAEWSKLAGAISKEHKVPGKAQWANIRELAVRCMSNPVRLPVELEGFCTQALRRKLWVDATVRRDGQSRNLYEALREKLGGNPSRLACLTLHHAAVEMSRKLARKDEKKGTNAQ